MDDDDLSDDERRALAALPREAPLPHGLEGRLVEALRARQLVTGGSPVRRPRRRLLRLAVAAGLFTAGMGAGFLLGRAPASAPANGGLYLLLLYAGPGTVEAPPEEERARVAEYGAWAGTLRREGALVLAEKLETRAPVVEGAASSATAEAPQGFFLVRARDLEEARRIARACPHVRHGGRVTLQAVEAT
jgi:hypothetical protein